MKRTIVFSDEQELGLSYVAAKEEMKVDEYIQKVFSDVADKYVKMMRTDEAKIVTDNFIKTGEWETDVAVIKAVEEVSAEPIK